MLPGKPKEARKALQWLRGSKADISTEMGEIERVAAESEKSPSDSSRVLELFSKANLKPLLITIGLMFFQQMSGINAVIFYSTKIFKVSKAPGPKITGSIPRCVSFLPLTAGYGCRTQAAVTRLCAPSSSAWSTSCPCSWRPC